MVKFLHIADFHIGNKFLNKNEAVRSKLKKSLFDSFDKIVDFSIENDLDALIIAGDLFDDEAIGFASENKVFARIKKLSDSGIRIFYCTGNHDHFHRNNLYNKLKDEKNFFLFSDSKVKRMNFISKTGERVSIVGCGHDRANLDVNMVKKYPSKMDRNITIGIAHTMVVSGNSAADGEIYMPCSLEDLTEKKYDYFALGHIHKRMQLDSEGKIWYSGSPQGLNYKEVGYHGGNFVKIDGENTFVDFVRFGEVLWLYSDIDVDNSISTVFDLSERLEREIASLDFAKEDFVILRINLSGATSIYRDIVNDCEMEDLLEDIAAKNGIFHIDVKTDELTPAIDIEKYLNGNNIFSKILEGFDNPDIIDQLTKEFSDYEFLSKRYKNDDLKNVVEHQKEEIIKRMIKW